MPLNTKVKGHRHGTRRRALSRQEEYQVLGQRPVRHDGADKVTGKAIYAADVQLPNMAHGKIVRSPHAHAQDQVDRCAARR